MANDADGTGGTDDLAHAADRSHSILTPGDREFLLGRKTGYTDHSKKQKRNWIRRHLRNATLDFTILSESLKDRDCETVFNPSATDREAYTRGITDMLAFLHLRMMGYYTPFKDVLAGGVNKVEWELADSDYRMITVDFNVEPVGQIDVDAIINKLKRGAFDQLTDEELQALVRLLAESDDFSATDLCVDMKAQMSEFVERINAANERCDRRIDDLNDWLADHRSPEPRRSHECVPALRPHIRDLSEIRYHVHLDSHVAEE